MATFPAPPPCDRAAICGVSLSPMLPLPSQLPPFRASPRPSEGVLGKWSFPRSSCQTGLLVRSAQISLRRQARNSTLMERFEPQKHEDRPKRAARCPGKTWRAHAEGQLADIEAEAISKA